MRAFMYAKVMTHFTLSICHTPNCGTKNDENLLALSEFERVDNDSERVKREFEARK